MEITYEEEMKSSNPEFENEFRIAVFPFQGDDLHVIYSIRNDEYEIERVKQLLEQALDEFAYDWWERDDTSRCVGDYCNDWLEHGEVEFKEIDTDTDDFYDTFMEA